MNFVRSHIEPFYVRLTGAQWFIMFLTLMIPTVGFLYVLSSISNDAFRQYIIVQALTSFLLLAILGVLDTLRLWMDITRGTRKERFSNAAFTILCTSFIWMGFLDYLLIKHMHT